jgi:hypothetical protein
MRRLWDGGAMSKPEAKRTEYGFQFGAAKVECLASDEKKGYVYIGLETPKHKFQFYVTKSGKVRIYTNGMEVLS